MSCSLVYAPTTSTQLLSLRAEKCGSNRCRSPCHKPQNFLKLESLLVGRPDCEPNGATGIPSGPGFRTDVLAGAKAVGVSAP
jgi:hypothetical protein